MERKSVATGALILTLAGVLTRLLGFVYRIYMSNIIGAEGMGIYQLIMPVYGLAWSIACSGFTTTISKLTAQELAKHEYGNMGRILKQSVLITTIIATVLSVLLYFFAGAMAEYIINDTRTVLPLRIMSIAFPFMAAGSCVRGYFLGLQETIVPALNQVLEQCVRMTVIYLLAGAFIPFGLEYACTVAVIGIVCEEIFSLGYVMLNYKAFKKKNALTKKPSMSSQKVFTVIMTMALPLTANRVTGSLLSTLENILIPQRLQLFGLSQSEAISSFGRISGMAMPLIMFPSALLVALSTTLIPSISESQAVKNYARVSNTVSKSMLFASITGIGAASVFVVFSYQLGFAIYKQDIGQMLFLMGLMCPFMYIHVIFSGVLNGLGYQVFLFRNSIISSLICIIFIYFLVPFKGLNAFIFGWFASNVVVCAIEIEKLRKSINLEMEYKNWFIKPVISALFSGLAAKLAYDKIFQPISGNVYGLILSVMTLLILYLVGVTLTGALNIDDVIGMFKHTKKRGSAVGKAV